MDEGETDKQLIALVEQLQKENELLRARIKELEARLAQYENPHTPPSLRHGRNRRKDPDHKNKGKPGQRIGHEGVTRPSVTPDKQLEFTLDRCPDCGAELGSPVRIETKIVEEIPKPQPITVTEYKISHYRCPGCQKEVFARDPSCPNEGKFGNNVIALATMLKYEDRLPHRKVHDAMIRLYGLKISPATILDLIRPLRMPLDRNTT